MSAADLYGPCPSCGVNVDPWEHDCLPPRLSPDRERLDVDTLRSTCASGHTLTVPDKGIGRANLAAWETRHSDCVPSRNA